MISEVSVTLCTGRSSGFYISGNCPERKRDRERDTHRERKRERDRERERYGGRNRQAEGQRKLFGWKFMTLCRGGIEIV